MRQRVRALSHASVRLLATTKPRRVGQSNGDVVNGQPCTNHLHIRSHHLLLCQVKGHLGNLQVFAKTSDINVIALALHVIKTVPILHQYEALSFVMPALNQDVPLFDPEFLDASTAVTVGHAGASSSAFGCRARQARRLQALEQ